MVFEKASTEVIVFGIFLVMRHIFVDFKGGISERLRVNEQIVVWNSSPDNRITFVSFITKVQIGERDVWYKGGFGPLENPIGEREWT